MRAIDTNIVVRYLTDDDARDSPRARAVIQAGPVFVPTTVILETEWVLRVAYRLSQKRIAEVLTEFAGLPSVTLENPDLVGEALHRIGIGLEFPDALHLGASADCEALLTFDRDFQKKAGRLSDAIPVMEP